MSFNWRATLSASVALIIVLSTAGAQISTMFSDQLIHDEYRVNESITSSTSMDGINQAIAHIDAFAITTHDGHVYTIDQNLEKTSIIVDLSIQVICSSGGELLANMGSSLAKITNSGTETFYTLSDSEESILDFDCNDEFVSLISSDGKLVTLSAQGYEVLNSRAVQGDSIQLFTDPNSNSAAHIVASNNDGLLNYMSQTYNREVQRPESVILDYEYNEITQSLTILYSDGTLFENKMKTQPPAQKSSSLGSSTNAYIGSTTILPNKGLVASCTSQVSAGYQPMPMQGSSISFYDAIENSVENLDIDGISGTITDCVSDANETSILVVSDTGSMVKISIEISDDGSDGGIDLIITAAVVVGAIILLSAIGAIVVIRIGAANSKSKAKTSEASKQQEPTTETNNATMDSETED